MLTNSHRRQLTRWDAAALVILIALVAAALAFVMLGSPQPATRQLSSTHNIVIGMAELPTGFTPNEGQAPSSIRFMAHQKGGSVLLLQSQAVLLPDPMHEKRTFGRGPAGSEQAEIEPIVLTYEGANPEVALEGEMLLPGKANYFLGSDHAGWRTGLPTFGAVVSISLYPGIDLRYEGSGSRLESEYTILPGADLQHVRLRYATTSGSIVPRMDKAGDLHVAGRTALTAKAPVAWQFVGPFRVPVSMGYVVLSDGTAGLQAGAYDRTKPLHVSTSLTYSFLPGRNGHRQRHHGGSG